MDSQPPDHHPHDVWTGAGAYEGYVGRWGRLVAPAFVSWIDVPSGSRWLDVGCGTGAVTATIVDLAAPGAVMGVDSSKAYLAEARATLSGPRVSFETGDALALPAPDRSFDAVVAGLVLNFVSDPGAALAEWRRVTVAGGIVAAYVWDYAGRMELIRAFWDAAISLDPAARALDEGVRFPIAGADALADLFRAAGLVDVTTLAIDVPTHFSDFDDVWQPFLGGQGPAPAYVMSLSAGDRDALQGRLRSTLPSAPDGSIDLTARAWAVRARSV